MIREILLGSLLLGVLSIGSPGTGAADEALEIARKRYQVGEQEFIAGRYWQAAKAFEEAYDLSKRIDLLYNAARAYDRGDYTVRAIEAYEAYLKAGEVNDKAQIERRLAALRKSLATISIKTDETAFIFVDGHEYGKTPMKEPIPMDSGYHRVEVRTGNRTWSREQQFSSGQTYELVAYLSEEKSGPGAGLVAVGSEDQRPKSKTRKLAVVLGAGVVVDMVGENFPPLQVAVGLGAEYRMVEGTYGGLDLSLKIPVEFLNGWVNSGFLVGLRGALTPVPRLPLELVVSADLGLGVLDYRSNHATFGAFVPGDVCLAQYSNCTFYGVRFHPAFNFAYRVAPAAELRLEALGIDLNFTSPLVDPRLTFGGSFAYRF